MKGTGMLVGSLGGGGGIHGVWSSLGYSVQNANIFSCQGIFRFAREEILFSWSKSIRK